MLRKIDPGIAKVWRLVRVLRCISLKMSSTQDSSSHISAKRKIHYNDGNPLPVVWAVKMKLCVHIRLILRDILLILDTKFCLLDFYNRLRADTLKEWLRFFLIINFTCGRYHWQFWKFIHGHTLSGMPAGRFSEKKLMKLQPEKDSK